jgi:hypothetical protein
MVAIIFPLMTRFGDLASALFVWLASAWALEMSRPELRFVLAVHGILLLAACVLWRLVPIRLGRWYYRVRPFEAHGRLYERLGARHYQRFLRRSGWMTLNPWQRYRRGPGGLEALRAGSERGETAHVLLFVAVSIAAARLAWNGEVTTALWLTAFNLPLNLLPVLSLRHLRARLARLCPAELARCVDPTRGVESAS